MDWFVLLTPFLLLGIVALLGFIGCDRLLGLTPVNPTPPKIGSISPTSGPTSGGTTVMISGSNLSNTGSVKFGSADATINAADTTDSSLTVTSPPGSAGTVDVTATAGTMTSNSESFTYIAINFVQTYSAESPTGPSISVALPNPTGQGNLLIAAVSYVNSGNPVTVTDNLGNTFTQAGSGPWVRESGIYYFPNHPGGNVKVTATGVGGPCSMCVSEYSGANATSPIYTFSTQKANTGTAGIEVIEGISIALPQSSDVIYAVVFASKDSQLMVSGNFTAHAQPTTSLLVADSTMPVTAGQLVATDDSTGTFVPWVILGVGITT